MNLAAILWPVKPSDARRRKRLAVGLLLFAVVMIGGSLLGFQLEDAGLLESLPDKRWVAARLFGVVGFGGVVWDYRAWRSLKFWGWLCVAVFLHTLGFYVVLRSFPQWPVAGTVLVSWIEVVLLGLLLTR